MVYQIMDNNTGSYWECTYSEYERFRTRQSEETQEIFFQHLQRTRPTYQEQDG